MRAAHARCRRQARMRHPTAMLAAALLALLTLPAVQADWQDEEPGILLKLSSWVGTIPERWPEVKKRNPLPRPGGHHCQWRGVECDATGRVTTLLVHDAGGDTTRDHDHPVSRALLPELAKLEALERLSITARTPFPDGIPAAWLQPGAFPRLKQLHLQAQHLGTPLPSFQPGVLPSLEQLSLDFERQEAELPASWGSPDVLPRLQELKMFLYSVAALPEGWAAGFRQLTNLFIACVAEAHPPPCESAAAVQARGVQLHELPAAWAHGFPALRFLEISTGASGTIPPAWEAGFPNLTRLDLSTNRLTGPLPARLLSNQSWLDVVYLSNNCFTGGLPDSYASASVRALILSNNSLSGAAFPPAWLELGALPKLEHLDLSHNRGLSGTLPANLSWPQLETLNILKTDVQGTIPASWCQSPFANSFERLFVTAADVSNSAAQLPACAANTMPKLAIYTNLHMHRTTTPPVQPWPWWSDSTAGPTGGRGLRAAAIGMVALLAATALAALGRMRHLRQRQQPGRGSAEATQHDDQARLLGRLEAAAPAPPSNTSELSNRAVLCRQRRLAALLSKKSSQHSRSIQMMPLHALPGALTHRLAQHGQAAAAGNLSRTAAWLGSASSGVHSGTLGPVPAQRWMLDTHSLQLEPEELEFVTDRHGRLVVLGEGAHAVVYHGRLQGCDVAVKVYEAAGSVDPSLVWNEAAMLRSCTHPRIMPLYGISVEDNLIMLAMKHMEGGCMRDVLRQPDAASTLSWHNWGGQLALDIADGIAFLHNNMKCLHADLKASNVLIDEEGRACLADLALAKVLASQPARTAAGATYTYAAPEQLMGQRCTLAADMFSLGVLLIEITTRTLTTKRGGWRLPRAPSECPQAVVDLITECISLDPLRRPTATQALQCLQAAYSGAGSN